MAFKKNIVTQCSKAKIYNVETCASTYKTHSSVTLFITFAYASLLKACTKFYLPSMFQYFDIDALNLKVKSCAGSHSSMTIFKYSVYASI